MEAGVRVGVQEGLRARSRQASRCHGGGVGGGVFFFFLVAAEVKRRQSSSRHFAEGYLGLANGGSGRRRRRGGGVEGQGCEEGGAGGGCGGRRRRNRQGVGFVRRSLRRLFANGTSPRCLFVSSGGVHGARRKVGPGSRRNRSWCWFRKSPIEWVSAVWRLEIHGGKAVHDAG